MSDSQIKMIVMPKWGLSMSEGKVVKWLAKEGAKINVGDELLEVETEKIASAVEATDSGTLRRIVGEVDTVYPVKQLLAVIADDSVSDSEIDAFLASYVPPAVDEEGEAEKDAYEYIDLPIGTVRYAKYGDGGKTLLFIHGFGGDLDNWLFNVNTLAENHTVYAVDLPGHGRSIKSLTDASLAGLSKFVLEFMDALSIDSANLVGHSLGGAIAMKTAITAPKRVKTVTIIGSAGLGTEINLDYINGFIGSESRREIKPFLEELFFDRSLVGRQMIDDILKFKRLDNVTDVLRQLADTVFKGGHQAEKLGDAAAASGVPILAIHGTEDQIIPAAHTEALKGKASVHVMGDAGHMVQMEKSKETNKLISDHIK
jgi:pyruvate dehydrogenase E2 component (dihydrolipoamide acetyltransferase)